MLRHDRPPLADAAERIATRVRARSPIVRAYFEREAPRIALAARALAERFERGGTLFAFGRGAYATDAAHLSVEFVHPVIVGKRALAAFDLSAAIDASVDVLVGRDDIVIALGPPVGDPELARPCAVAADRGALTLALPGQADFAFEAACADEHIHQEVFELVGHTLYESVHVFLEHRGRGVGTGASSFLYPFLHDGSATADLDDVATSILRKVDDGERLRACVAADAAALAAATALLQAKLACGGRLLALGNGGSATDATDFVLDCIAPTDGRDAVPALSLSAEPAVLSAIANDVGMEHAFARQLIARARSNDAVVAFSTSGGSKNVVAALEAARTLGLASVAILGCDGGEVVRRNLADVAIVVASSDIPRIQETQATIYHVVREGLGSPP
ncbi:MAG: hypothetical protein NVS3B17_13770 [Vulcanimicrobiaceae bacterium]